MTSMFKNLTGKLTVNLVAGLFLVLGSVVLTVLPVSAETEYTDCYLNPLYSVGQEYLNIDDNTYSNQSTRNWDSELEYTNDTLYPADPYRLHTTDNFNRLAIPSNQNYSTLTLAECRAATYDLYFIEPQVNQVFAMRSYTGGYAKFLITAVTNEKVSFTYTYYGEPTSSIEGDIYYYGWEPGPVYVSAYEDATMLTSGPAPYFVKISPPMQFPMKYIIADVDVNPDYVGTPPAFSAIDSFYICAVKDKDDDQNYSSTTDPYGASYMNPITNISGRMTGANIDLNDPSFGGSISGTITYTGTKTGTLMINVYTDMGDPMGSMKGGFQIPISTTPVSEYYSIPNLSAGTYYVNALIDMNYNWISDVGEPYNDNHAGGGTAVAAAEVPNVDLTLEDYSISSTLTLDGNGYDFSTQASAASWGEGADILYTTAFGGTDLEAYSVIKDMGETTLDAVTTFDLEGVTDGHLPAQVGHVYIFPSLEARSVAMLVTDITSGVVTFEFKYDYGIVYGTGAIDGVVDSSGITQTGTIVVSCWRGGINTGTTIAQTDANADTGAYLLQNLVDATDYYVLAFLDLDGNWWPDYNEPTGNAGPIEVASGAAPAVNITLAEPTSGGPFTIRGAVGSTSGDSWDPSSWTAMGNCVVKILDTQGDWNWDNDVMVSSTTTNTSFSTSNDGQKYNFEITGLDVTLSNTTNYEYRVQITKTVPKKYFANPPDQSISFYENDPTVKFIGFTQMELAPQVEVTELSVDTGVADSLTTVTISPDNDGTADMANINFKYTMTGATNDWQKSGQAKVIVDTSRDNVFRAFPHEKFFWDENGGPYVYMTTAGDDSTINLNGSTWSWFDSLTSKADYKISWDKFNSLQAGYDWSRDEWINSEELDSNNSVTKTVSWEGRDANWNAVANGTYKVQVQVDTPWWNTDDGIDFTNNTTLTVTVQTSGISGTVKTTAGTGIGGVRVNAGGPNSWGSSYTNDSGVYEISGLAPGSYHVNTETGQSGYPNADYPQEVTVTAGQVTPDINFTLESGGTIAGTVTIPAFSAFTDQWGSHEWAWLNINAWSPNSPQHGWAGFDVQASTYIQTKSYKLALAPGTYDVRAEMEGFGSEVQQGIVVESDATTALNLVMLKAGTISGTVHLPEGETAPEGGLFVDVSANSTDDKYFGWGGTHMEVGASSATYTCRSLLDATYNVKFQIWGRYKPGDYSETVTVADAADVTGIDYTFAAGSKISGTITISGDTSNYQMWQGDNSTTIQLWLNAWSPTSHFGTGTQVQIPKGVDQSVAYEISGLSDGATYHLDCWLFGYEMSPRPLEVTIPSGLTEVAGNNITLSGYAGSIAGTVTGYTDAEAVRVTCREPWWGDWQEPRYSDINTNGEFSITGLGTGEYILTVNEYYVKPSTSAPLGVPTGAFGTVTERTPLANGQALTGVALELSAGGAITGTITVTSATYSVGDLDGKFVTAVPMRMQWMGWAVPYMGEVRVTAGIATYAIQGLNADIYIVNPPTSLTEPTGEYWGPPPKDLAGASQTVTVGSGETQTGVNFALTDGYSITGSIQRPVGGEEDQFFIGLFKSGGGWEQLTETQLRFSNDQGNLSSRTGTFELTHVPSGNYMLRIFPWKMRYKMSTKEVTVIGAKVDVGTIVVSKGATIKGKLVDAATGEAVTSENSVEVQCEARPWVEGSWRSTNDGDQETVANCWETSGDRKTGTFYLRNLPAGTYVVRINASFSKREVSSSKNYVNVFIAGVVVPDSTEEVDIGTIKLREGVTISGQVTDTDGNGLANVLMEASPSAARGESTSSQGKTDAAGKYKIKGIDPSIGFWDVTAARRPWWGEGIRVRYGEEFKTNIPPRATNVNFELKSATANLSGKVLAASGVSFMMPFPGEEMPAAFLLLQNTAKAYTDPMGGVESITWPDGSFNIQGIVPGTYTLKVFSKGTATALVSGIVIEAGDNTIDDIQLVKGGAVYGKVKDAQNKNINTTMFELPVAMKTDFSSMVFGTFNSNSVTKQIEGYRIEGLQAGVEYYVVLAADEGADVFISKTPVSVTSATDEVEHNITYTDLPPNFLVGVYKNEEGKYEIIVWATETLSESDPADVVSLKNTSAGDGISEGTLSDLEMHDNKQDVRGIYTPDASDIQCVLTITGHDLVGQEATPTDYTFGIGVDAFNLVIFNPLMGGTLEMGEGDDTQLEIPGGAIEETDSVEGTMSKVQTVSAGVTISGAPLSLAAYPPKFVQADKAPKPAQGDKVSPYYEVSIGTSEIAEGKSAKVTLTYTASSVDDTSTIDIYSFDGTKWVAELEGRTIDEVNHTISADIDHTSLFAVFETEGGAATTYTGDFKAYMYPSPFKPETDTTAYFRIKVPDSEGTGNTVEIKIYNIAGELVRELSGTIDGGTMDTIEWDGKNDGGEAVASGVYIYRLTFNDTEKQVEKIAVIK